ncbi:MAG: CHASE2 domain-containing protein [bacterium]|nr:CHASE2 domain-containing protein [bacterium]
MPKEKNRKRLGGSFFRTVNFWMSVGLSVLIVSVYVLSRPDIRVLPAPKILEIIEAKTLDFRFILRGPIQPRDDVVIVAVDEKTEDELGRWQSSGRQWIAKLLNFLHDADARVVGLDLALAEPDEGGGVKLAEELKTQYLEQFPDIMTSYPELLTRLDLAKDAHDYDRQLAQALRRLGNVVLGFYHFWNVESASHLTHEKRTLHQQLIEHAAYTMIEGNADQPLPMTHSYGIEANMAIFSEAAKSVGHFNVVPDLDGSIRFTPLLIEYDGDYYPSLSLEMSRVYLNPPLPPIIHAIGTSDGASIGWIEMGDVLIPCDEEGKLLINYYGPGHTFPHYSLADVMLGKIPPQAFSDKIVLLGFTSNIYQDVHSTPFQTDDYPGVEINATIIENILQNEFLIRPRTLVLGEALLILSLGLIVGVARHRKKPLFTMFIALLAIFCVLGIAQAAFIVSKIWLNITYPVLFVVLDYLSIASYNYFTEERQKRGIRNAFQHYVSPTVVTHMLDNMESLKLGGERTKLSALFSDIRGFTSISEAMTPDQLVEFLNEYLSEMTQIVLKYEGTVDKYMGDAIMAFYGAPLEQPDHAARAGKTAVDMMIRLNELRVDWKERRLPPMNIGIGINSGEMSVGNMGSRERFDYTIMGDNVNLASRLEGINKQYGTNIVTSEFTCALLHNESFAVRELDTVRVKGKEEPVKIYELFGYDNVYIHPQDMLGAYLEGLQMYKNQQWQHAIQRFRQALNTYPDDAPSQMYIDRCEQFLETSPPKNWDGVFTMKTK